MMETIISTLEVLVAVIVLLGLSGFISHLFGLDYFYTESMKGDNILDLSGLRRIDQEPSALDETNVKQSFDNINKGMQDSDF